MLKLKRTGSFKRDLKKYKHDKNLLLELENVIKILLEERPIPAKYKNHKLTGNYEGLMELHLRPDDLLVYLKIEKESISLYAIGSHTDLF